MAVVWRSYLRFLDKYPLVAMASTTGTLMAAGDSISQVVVEGKNRDTYDITRSGRFFVIGFCVLGPMMRGWYFALDKMYAGSKKAGLKMVLTDQTCATPVFISVFLSGMGMLRMESTDIIKSKIKRDFWPILKTNYKVWPFVQFVNFTFLPLQHRVLFVNFIALFWNTYLAWISEKK